MSNCRFGRVGARKQLELAVDRHVPHAGRLDPLANGVVVLAARVVELPTLDVDRLARPHCLARWLTGGADQIPRLRRVREEPVVEVGDLIPKWHMSGEPVAHYG